jgi:hypothetical protein
MISAGHDMNAEFQTDSRKYKYPILAVAFEERWDAVSLLMDSGASTNVTCENETILGALARATNTEDWWLFKKVLDEGGLEVIEYSSTRRNDPFSRHESVLISVARHPLDAGEMMGLLVQKGADVNDSTYFARSEEDTKRKSRESAKFGSPALQHGQIKATKRL